MRKPTTHSEVAHQWASRKIESASCGNMSFKNGIIYSYDWWPIAKFCKTEEAKEYVIMTSWSYSSSTSKHINYTRQAIPKNISVYYSNIRNREYYGSREPLLNNESVLATILEDIILSYNNYMLPKTHGKYNTSEELVRENHSIYNKAEVFSKFTGLSWDQNFDKYKISDHEISIMQILAAPVIEKREKNRNEREKKEELLKEARERIQKKYGREPIQMAKDWIQGKVEKNQVELPKDDPDAILLRWPFLYLVSETAMRIDGKEIVTNQGARISLNSGKRLWNMMKNNQSIIGEKCDVYTVLKNNGELVIGCHHIKREIVDFFVEYYKW